MLWTFPLIWARGPDAPHPTRDIVDNLAAPPDFAIARLAIFRVVGREVCGDAHGVPPMPDGDTRLDSTNCRWARGRAVYPPDPAFFARHEPTRCAAKNGLHCAR